jgi:membrane protein
MRVILARLFVLPIGWTTILSRTGHELYRGRCFAWAAAVAYYSFLALFPALLFAAALASFLPVQRQIDQVIRVVDRVAPRDVVRIAREQLLQIVDQPQGGLLVLSLLAAVWSMSSGMVALMETLNQALDIEDSRPWWKVRGIATALTLGLATFMLISFTLVMLGPGTAQALSRWIGFGNAFTQAWEIVRWPAAFIAAMTALGIVYHFAPDRRRPFVWITPGALAATVLWLVASVAFKLYVVQFGSYQKTYGAIGGVIVVLLWFYVSCLSVLLGAQLNATIANASAEVPSVGA